MCVDPQDSKDWSQGLAVQNSANTRYSCAHILNSVSGRLKQKACEFEGSLDHIVSPDQAELCSQTWLQNQASKQASKHASKQNISFLSALSSQEAMPSFENY